MALLMLFICSGRDVLDAPPVEGGVLQGVPDSNRRRLPEGRHGGVASGVLCADLAEGVLARGVVASPMVFPIGLRTSLLVAFDGYERKSRLDWIGQLHRWGLRAGRLSA